MEPSLVGAEGSDRGSGLSSKVSLSVVFPLEVRAPVWALRKEGLQGTPLLEYYR